MKGNEGMKKRFITKQEAEFLKAFKDAVNKMADERMAWLLEKDLEQGSNGKYFEGYDSDSVDVGVGYVKVREDVIQDEETAFDDAKKEIVHELVTNSEDASYNLFEDADFQKALRVFLTGEE